MAKAGIVYVGGDDGLLIFSDPASSGRWRRVGHELQGQQVRNIVAHSALVLDLAAGGAGVWHSDDGGQRWRQISTANAIALAAHPAAPHTLFLLTAAGALERSADGGATWQRCPQGERPYTVAADASGLLVDPHAAQRVLVWLQNDGVWVSPDGGQSWERLGAGLPAGLKHLAASPGRVNLLFAVAGDTLRRAGESALWARVGETAGDQDGPFRGPLALLPGKTEVLLAAISGPDGAPALARSDDDGETWQSADSEAPLRGQVTVITPSAYHLDTAWAGTDSGQLLRSDNRGRAWHIIAHDLAPVRALAVVRLA